MRELIPLLVAFIGAAFGTYFAILRNRKERLWTDRYECLLHIVELAESLKDKVLIQKSDSRLAGEYGTEELAINLVNELGSRARFELRKESSKIRLLFPEKDSRKIVEALQDLDRSLTVLHSSRGSDVAYEINVVWSIAESCIDESVGLSRRKCI
jgi:hypothetical protein